MEELARRIAGIEQPLLERSRAGPPPRVAREHLVDPADDRVGRRFDPPGGGPGAARRGSRFIRAPPRAATGRRDAARSTRPCQTPAAPGKIETSSARPKERSAEKNWRGGAMKCSRQTGAQR